ncbi:MAG TPA: transposase [Longimicrobium sp.]
MDATGLEAHYASPHYRYVYSERYVAAYAALHGGRRPAGPHYRPGHPKLTAVVHAGSHLILGAIPNVGPAHDTPDFAPAMRQAATVLRGAAMRFAAVTADAGYDAEHCHVLCREQLGIPKTAIALNRRMHDAGRLPRTRYRREMRRRFPRTLYRARQQAESTFSQHKRRLGPALTTRSAAAQAGEQILRVLTHNVLILHHGSRTFQQSR